MSTESFIERAKAIHGERYDYRESVYHYRTPIKIICRKHGAFFQRYDHHLDKNRRGGCKKCYSESLLLDHEVVIEKMISKHGSLFDYSKTVYKDMRSKLVVICKKHGEFLITPALHIAGRGCKRCQNEANTLSQSDFLKKANLIHKGKYSYEKSVYKNCAEWLTITCPIHGDFQKTPDNHCHKTSPQGCPKCAEYRGYRRYETGYLYVLISTDNSFVKAGITNSPKKRLKALQRATPFCFKMAEIKKFSDGSEPPVWERLIHKAFESANLSGFDGCTEWMINTPKLMQWLSKI